VAQKEASGITSPAALAFAGSFITESVLYSLPGPWQLSQSSGGVRLACAFSAQETYWSLWQSLHFSAPIRVAPGLVEATATAPPGSWAFEALASVGAEVGDSAAGAAGAGRSSVAGCAAGSDLNEEGGFAAVGLLPGETGMSCARFGGAEGAAAVVAGAAGCALAALPGGGATGDASGAGDSRREHPARNSTENATAKAVDRTFMARLPSRIRPNLASQFSECLLRRSRKMQMIHTVPAHRLSQIEQCLLVCLFARDGVEYL